MRKRKIDDDKANFLYFLLAGKFPFFSKMASEYFHLFLISYCIKNKAQVVKVMLWFLFLREYIFNVTFKNVLYHIHIIKFMQQLN